MRKAIILGLAALMMAMATVAYAAPGQSELAQVREATAQFHQFERGFAAGYDDFPPLPCTEGMGWHYLNADLLDLDLDPAEPEVLMYEEGKDGKMTLVGVEYIVPMGAWDAVSEEPPSLFGEEFGTHPLGLYVLHAWVWRTNPDGVFTGSNPRVVCTYADPIDKYPTP